jgi:hypothetical protein
MLSFEAMVRRDKTILEMRKQSSFAHVHFLADIRLASSANMCTSDFGWRTQV